MPPIENDIVGHEEEFFEFVQQLDEFKVRSDAIISMHLFLNIINLIPKLPGLNLR